jgi:hypothetical protein
MKFSTILITVCCLVLSVACNNNKQNEIRTINELKALAEQIKALNESEDKE